jgi:hypothetical protein
MGKKLTVDEWKDAILPFSWIKLKLNIDEIQMDFIDKWLIAHTSGWWYRGPQFKRDDELLMVFQWDEDLVMFKLWSTNNPFKEDYGEIK